MTEPVDPKEWMELGSHEATLSLQTIAECVVHEVTRMACEKLGVPYSGGGLRVDADVHWDVPVANGQYEIRGATITLKVYRRKDAKP